MRSRQLLHQRTVAISVSPVMFIWTFTGPEHSFGDLDKALFSRILSAARFNQFSSLRGTAEDLLIRDRAISNPLAVGVSKEGRFDDAYRQEIISLQSALLDPKLANTLGELKVGGKSITKGCKSYYRFPSHYTTLCEQAIEIEIQDMNETRISVLALARPQYTSAPARMPRLFALNPAHPLRR